MRSVVELATQVMKALPHKYKGHIDNIIGTMKFGVPEVVYVQKINDFVNKIAAYPPVEDWEHEAFAALMDISVKELKDSVLADVEL